MFWWFTTKPKMCSASSRVVFYFWRDVNAAALFPGVTAVKLRYDADVSSCRKPDAVQVQSTERVVVVPALHRNTTSNFFIYFAFTSSFFCIYFIFWAVLFSWVLFLKMWKVTNCVRNLLGDWSWTLRPWCEFCFKGILTQHFNLFTSAMTVFTLTPLLKTKSHKENSPKDKLILLRNITSLCCRFLPSCCTNSEKNLFAS